MASSTTTEPLVPQDVHSLADRGAELRGFIASLGALVTGLEARFLPLGSDLSEITADLERLARASQHGLARIRQHLEGDVVGELQRRTDASVAGLREELDRMRSSLAPLRRVSGELHRVCDIVGKVGKIADFLEICRSSFAVETSRSPETKHTFAAFLGDMRALAVRLRDLGEQVEDDSRGTLVELDRDLQELEQARSALEQMCESIGHIFGVAAADIAALVCEARNAVTAVEARRDQIAARTSDIVFYLQFGDVIRQKCEHVLTATQEALRFGSDEERAPTAAASLRSILQTETVQLELIRAEIVEAHERLELAYRALGQALAELVAASAVLGGGNTADGRATPWLKLEGHLSELSAAQVKAARLGEGARSTAVAACDAVALLQKHFRGVREVSKRLHVLAINATIQASRVGGRDRALLVLSREIDVLHGGCTKLAHEVIRGLDSITGEVSALTLQRESAELPARRADDADLRIGGHGASLDEIVLHARRAEERLAAASMRLTGLAEMGREVDRQRAVLQRVLSALPAGDAAADEAITAQLMSLYTMQTERDAHLLVQSGGALSSALTRQIVPPRTSGVDEDDLGDNVELF